jgi:mannose-1-phosphate guanylyltransferase
MAKVYAVIMAGGAGTRFWPASRAARPKQLLALTSAEEGGETLLASTVRRLRPLVPIEQIFIVTGEHLADATALAVPGVPPEQILLEPAPRNTAPCIAWANATIARLDPDAVVIVLPSDHFIGDEAGFQRVLAEAVGTAERGFVTTVGIVPTRAETGYGYIEVGEALAKDENSDKGGGGGGGPARRVGRFVEKPNRERAESFLAAGPGRYLWNAGMFFFRVRDMTALVSQHLPDVAAGIAKIDAASAGETEVRYRAVVRTVFPTLPSISIDHGVMEKTDRLAVIPGDFDWNDVGSWESAWELAPHDDRGNALGPGDVAIDARNNLVRSVGAHRAKAIALVGVENLVVVQTDDAILVIPRDRAQDVRLVVENLKKAGRTDLT